MRRLLTLSLLVLGMLIEARAGMDTPVSMKCPVGGKKFTHITTGSYSQWGSRPDGKPYGSWTFPMPLPECPDNGLVVYRDFTRAEVKTLKGILSTPDYRKLRQDDTPYYRAFWLMERLGDPADERLWMLQQAAWESDGEAERKARYQSEFVARAIATARPAAGEDDLEWIATQLRAANALRELGKFEDAMQRLQSTPLTSLDVPVPEQKVSGTTPSGLGKYVDNMEEIRAAERRRSWLGYADLLRAVIARQDASSEAIDMIPARVAAGRCRDAHPAKPEYQQVCESASMRALLDRSKPQ